MSLFALGWDDSFVRAFAPFSAAGLVPARVSIQHKHAFELLSAHGASEAECTGRLLHLTASPGDLPAVGDWVAVRFRAGESPSDAAADPRADIHAVLPRRTKFSRRASGDVDAEQVVAANVDTVLLVTALDQNFNLRRIERYLAVAWESGAQPVIVLNKADLHPDAAAARAEVAAIAGGAPVVALSALAADSVQGPSTAPLALAPWLVPGRTLALLGSSGVGKSTLINRLVGEERQRTMAISDAVGKGRHVTTHRELIVTPSGALVIDTPGMRELQLWEVDRAAMGATFADIGALAARCRFRDCTHRAEPGCAIQMALEEGSLAPGRWQSFQKLQREQAYAARRADPQLDREHRAAWKKIHKQHRVFTRMTEREE
jgi:ribosome biogenesis GTPase / thiamine phosphate phosphatase